jgi:hypothetical protein
MFKGICIHLDNPLSIEQFLGKLPGSVIHNGKLIDIRNDLSTLITVSYFILLIQKKLILLVA